MRMTKKGGWAMVIILTAAMMAWAGAQQMSVRVKKGQVRNAPSFIGKILMTLPYGRQVAVSGEKDGWAQVNAGGKTGWMHTSALSEKKIILKPDAAQVNQYASSDEVALAGKGFNRAVEKEYRAANPNLDFSWIDRMEREMGVSQTQMMKFIRRGELVPEGGA